MRRFLRTLPGAPAPAVAALLAAACGEAEPQSALAPAGPAAAAILELQWVLVALSTFVVLLVVGLLVYALFRRRDFHGTPPPLRLSPDVMRGVEKAREQGGVGTVQEVEGPREYIAEQTGRGVDETAMDVRLGTADEDRTGVRWALVGGLVFPVVVLTALFVYVMTMLAAIHAPDEEPELAIEVIGRQFWWEVHYLDAEGRRLFETANEIHVPAGTRVELRLESPDVIHSFWVPRLGGKLDMIPGRTNVMTLKADEPGVYRGQCAEYCGLQHAKMALLLIAEPEGEYRQWVEHQMRDAVELDDPLAVAGREVFLSTACSSCHAVRGTSAAADFGPDLTHVASRRTLAAVTIPNTRGHMGGWIADPQAIKPGVEMPAVPLDNEDLLAILHYMMSLK